MAQTVEGLAYELSLAAISQQESRANELRSRTGTLIAAAAVTVGVEVVLSTMSISDIFV